MSLRSLLLLPLLVALLPVGTMCQDPTTTPGSLLDSTSVVPSKAIVYDERQLRERVSYGKAVLKKALLAAAKKRVMPYVRELEMNFDADKFLKELAIQNAERLFDRFPHMMAATVQWAGLLSNGASGDRYRLYGRSRVPSDPICPHRGNETVTCALQLAAGGLSTLSNLFGAV